MIVSRFSQFPDFDKVIKDLKDIRTIMLEAEQGKYKYVFVLVADLRLIIQSCKLYLNVSQLVEDRGRTAQSLNNFPFS